MALFRAYFDEVASAVNQQPVNRALKGSSSFVGPSCLLGLNTQLREFGEVLSQFDLLGTRQGRFDQCSGRFFHGFNSGALAAFRYVLDIIETGVEHAEEEFPNLDT